MKLNKPVMSLLAVAVAAGMFACSPSGGGSAELGDAAGAEAAADLFQYVPAGEYAVMATFRLNDLMNSEFVSNVKSGIPMAGMMFNQMANQMNDSGVSMESFDVMAMVGDRESGVAVARGSFDIDEMMKAYEDANLVEVEEKSHEGSTYWLNPENNDSMAAIGDMMLTGSEDMIKKVLEVKAGKLKAISSSESFATAKDFLNANATGSFFTTNVNATFDSQQVRSQLQSQGVAEEEIDSLVDAMGKAESVGGVINIDNAIAGSFAMIFSDAGSASTVAEYAQNEMEKMFEEAAGQLDQMASMLNLNADKKKFLALKDKITIKAEGSRLMATMNIHWDDIKFLFEKAE